MFTIIILILTDFAVLFNIPFLRQTFGFIFLTILPGLMILQLFKNNKLSCLDKFVLSWGISISFIMFFGLLINYISLRFNYQKPLGIYFLLFAFNMAFIVLMIINRDYKNWIPKVNLSLSRSEKLFLIVPLLFPSLSIVGMQIMNSENNNIILIIMFFLISIYVIIGAIHKFSDKIYPILIYLISLSLLLLLPLRTNHLIGADLHLEYYYFQKTISDLHWSVDTNTPLGACLSISMMPAIYNFFLNISQEFLFKIIYSLIYSISPLIIFIISSKYVEGRFAFLSSIFFMSQQNFLWTEYYSRTNIALLFYELAIMTIFSDKINNLQKKILFIIFMISIIVSHYSTAYIFFFLLVIAVIGIKIILSKRFFARKITYKMPLIFFILIFFWYSQVTIEPFEDGVKFIENTFINLNKFFINEMKGEPAQSILGEGFKRGIPYIIQFSSTWLTFVFIGIGILLSIIKYKEISFSEELNYTKLYFLKNKFDVEYWLFAIISSFLAIIMISFPFISKGYGIERAYPILITFLSVYFVIGGMTVANYLEIIYKRLRKIQFTEYSRKSWIVLIVLIPYFLSITGVIHELLGYPYQITLAEKEIPGNIKYLIRDQESFSAKWLKNHIKDDSIIYADYSGINRLISQGNFSKSSIDIKNLTRNKEVNGYVYLTYYNVINKKLYSDMLTSYNISDKIISKNKIYDSGASNIYN